MKNMPQLSKITTEFEGKSYSAHYSVTSKVVTLSSMYGSKSTQVGGSGASVIAGILFREILHSAKARGELNT